MHKIYLLLLVCLLSATAKAQAPVDENNKLARYIDTLYKMGTAWGNKLGTLSNSTKAYKELTEPRQQLEDYINRAIATLRSREEVSGSGPLKESIISFLVYEKELVANNFVMFEKFDATTKDEEVNAAMDKLRTASGLEEKKLREVQTEQVAYAKKNGFNIEQSKK